jgi:hypothetical protein
MASIICHKYPVNCHALPMRSRNSARPNCAINRKEKNMGVIKKVIHKHISTEQFLECPRFDSCSAPVCPADPNWNQRSYRKGEAVCFYMRLHAKDALKAAERGAIPDDLRDRVIKVYPKIANRYGPLKRRLERSSASAAKGFGKGGAR